MVSEGSVSISAASIGAELERQRLQHRAERVRKVLDELAKRAAAHRSEGGPTPAGLQAAMADFGRELSELRHRLSLLETSTG